MITRPPGGRSPHRRASRRRFLIGTLLGVSGCGGLAEPAPCPVPEILSAAAVANPNNVLSAVVTVRAAGADSVRVRYGSLGDPRDSGTPALPPTGDSTDLPVLGLRPETAYALEVVAQSACGSRAAVALDFTTGALPEDLPKYTASGDSPSSGFVVFGAGLYGVVIDNTGRVVWYHRFPRGPGLNFQAQPTGRYVARPNGESPAAPTPWVEVDPLGRVTRTLGCARGLQPRFHDLLAESDGSYWVLCDETRVMDLTSLAGVADARVLGTVVQRIGANGDLLFEWNAFDHFAITDLALADRAGSSVNWTHANAIDKDWDGNILVSFRSLSEITKIDVRSGAVLWRMGGLRNQFAFENTPMPPFARQHGLRSTGPGRLVLLDNAGEAFGSRAERYEIDEARRTARLSTSYAPTPLVVAELGGTTQDLPGGRILVSYGNGGRVEEYDAEGSVVWRIDGNAGYVFRAQRITSLYRPGIGSPR